MHTWQRIAAGVVLFSIASAGGLADGLLSISANTAPANGTAVVSLTLVGAPRTGALDAEITFPPDALQFVGAEVGSAAANGQLQVNAATPGRLKLALMDMDGLDGDGDVAVVTFKVLAPEGQAVQLDIPSATANHFEAMVEIPLELKGGQLRIVTAESSLPVMPPQMVNILLGVGVGIVVILIIALIARSKKKS